MPLSITTQESPKGKDGLGGNSMLEKLNYIFDELVAIEQDLEELGMKPFSPMWKSFDKILESIEDFMVNYKKKLK